jgi:hypothetical protein
MARMCQHSGTEHCYRYHEYFHNAHRWADRELGLCDRGPQESGPASGDGTQARTRTTNTRPMGHGLHSSWEPCLEQRWRLSLGLPALMLWFRSTGPRSDFRRLRQYGNGRFAVAPLSKISAETVERPLPWRHPFRGTPCLNTDNHSIRWTLLT